MQAGLDRDAQRIAATRRVRLPGLLLDQLELVNPRCSVGINLKDEGALTPAADQLAIAVEPVLFKRELRLPLAGEGVGEQMHISG